MFRECSASIRRECLRLAVVTEVRTTLARGRLFSFHDHHHHRRRRRFHITRDSQECSCTNSQMTLARPRSFLPSHPSSVVLTTVSTGGRNVKVRFAASSSRTKSSRPSHRHDRVVAGSIHFIGMWGTNDTTVPYLSNTNEPDKARDTAYDGWFYSTARNTTDRWAEDNACDRDTGPRSLSNEYDLEQFQDDVACVTWNDCDANVVECVFRGGHVCDETFQYVPVVNFLLSISSPSGGDRSDNTSTPSADLIVVVVVLLLLPVVYFSARRCRDVVRRPVKSFVQVDTNERIELRAS